MVTWTDEVTRSDGVVVQKQDDERWVIRRGSRVVDECPCCGRELLSAKAARLVADALFPRPEPEEW